MAYSVSSTPSAPDDSTVAGRSLRTARSAVSGEGTKRKVRKRSTASRSTSRGMAGSASSALTSDANARCPPARDQYSGLTPKRSRARCSAWVRRSHSAMAKMPSSRSTKPGPSSS